MIYKANKGLPSFQSHEEDLITNMTFGWVIQPVARHAVDVGILMDDNHRFNEWGRGSFPVGRSTDRGVLDHALNHAANYTDLTFGALVLGHSMLNLSYAISLVAYE